MKLYKLTDENDQTYNGTQWGPGITHNASGQGGLRGPGWLHAYTDPLLAILLNPIHANFAYPHLWEAEGKIEKTDRGLKVGTKRLTTINRLPLPTVTTKQRVKFAILCAQAVYFNSDFAKWASGWINGEDCSEAAAYAAARTAAVVAAYAAARAAAEAARAATDAATDAATYAAADAAAYAAAEAAGAAAYSAADAATVVVPDFDLVALAKRARA